MNLRGVPGLSAPAEMRWRDMMSADGEAAPGEAGTRAFFGCGNNGPYCEQPQPNSTEASGGRCWAAGWQAVQCSCERAAIIERLARRRPAATSGSLKSWRVLWWFRRGQSRVSPAAARCAMRRRIWSSLIQRVTRRAQIAVTCCGCRRNSCPGSELGWRIRPVPQVIVSTQTLRLLNSGRLRLDAVEESSNICHWRFSHVTGLLEGKRIVIAGGSGFLGISLASHLAVRGFSVVILSRSGPKVSGPWRHRLWDGRTLGAWRDELDGAAGLVNLAGRSVDCIKTPDHQDEILRSRVESTRVLGEAVRSIPSPPPAWVQMSTAHIYGDPPTVICTEESALGYGLAPFVGQAWEEAFHASVLPSQRGVILRTSFVLGRDRGAGGGALSTLGLLARVGLGGKVGSGTQGMSWIHEVDMNRLFERGLTDTTMQGVYIASAPIRYPRWSSCANCAVPSACR